MSTFDENDRMNDENEENKVNEENKQEEVKTEEHSADKEVFDDGNMPSHTYDYSANNSTGSVYSMKGSDIVKDESDVAGRVPDYSTSHVDGNGISYTPVPDTPRKKRSGGRFLLAALCVILSLACGFAGSYLGNVVFDGNTPAENTQTDNGSDDSSNVNKVVIDRVVEHVETSSDGSELTYSDVEALVGDSVVAITTEYKVTSFWQEYVTSGAGSGVVISEDGYIITNNHVIATDETSYYGTTTTYADKITVSFKNGNEYEATVIGGDASADIAVIKIEPEEDDKLVTAKFADSDKLKVGEEVIAIGNPLGELSGTTTNGIISALAREVTIEDVDMNLLQTNAAINPGNSGGGLFNMSGELVGVVNAKSSGTGIEGLGFAIPSNDAYATATKIIETGGAITNTASVKIGITTVDIFTASDAREFGVNVYGVYVYEVQEGFNDDVLKAGDRIIAIDSQEIAAGDDVVSIVRASKAGDKLEFFVYRDGRLKNIEVTVYDNTTTDNVEF